MPPPVNIVASIKVQAILGAVSKRRRAYGRQCGIVEQIWLVLMKVGNFRITMSHHLIALHHDQSE
jgi:hypothetical protein